MRGCRPLTPDESRRVYAAYSGRHKLRNQCLHMLCVTTGLRVSEALSLRIGDVVKKGRIVRRVQIARQNTKRAMSGRTIDLPTSARAAINRHVFDLAQRGKLGRADYLFSSYDRGKAITRRQAWHIFNSAALAAGLDEDLGALGTHSWRKTFADQANRHFITLNRNGENLNPMLETCRALGHRSMESTEKYLSFKTDYQQTVITYMDKIHEYALG